MLLTWKEVSQVHAAYWFLWFFYYLLLWLYLFLILIHYCNVLFLLNHLFCFFHIFVFIMTCLSRFLLNFLIMILLTFLNCLLLFILSWRFNFFYFNRIHYFSLLMVFILIILDWFWLLMFRSLWNVIFRLTGICWFLLMNWLVILKSLNRNYLRFNIIFLLIGINMWSWLFMFFFWRLLFRRLRLNRRLLNLSSTIIFDKKLSNNRIGIETIHTLLKCTILKDRHFRIWPNTHLPTEMMIITITINLINIYIPSIMYFKLINNIFEEFTISTPRCKEFENRYTIISSLRVNNKFMELLLIDKMRITPLIPFFWCYLIDTKVEYN